MFRELREYKKPAAPENPKSVIHTTFEPTTERDDFVEFDIKSAGLTGHMSSVMYLEREINFYVAQVSRANEMFVLSTNDSHRRLYRPLDKSQSFGLAFAVKPGFTLQENIKKMHFTFNGGSSSFDTQWLAPYSKLYEKELKSFVRGSGHSFSNHQDRVLRGLGLNVLNSLHKTVYCNPERNDRRIRPILSFMSYDVDPFYYRSYPLESGANFDPSTTTIGNLFTWSSDLSIAIPNAAPDVLPQTTNLSTIRPDNDPNTLSIYYAKHFAQADAMSYDVVTNIIRKLYFPDLDGVDKLKHFKADGVDTEWQNLKDIYQDFFYAGYGAANHFNWGVDLTQPFPDQKKDLHFRTVALLYRFANVVLKYFEDINTHPTLSDINDAREKLDYIADEIAKYPGSGVVDFYEKNHVKLNTAIATRMVKIANGESTVSIDSEIAFLTHDQTWAIDTLRDNGINISAKLDTETTLAFLNRMGTIAQGELDMALAQWQGESHAHDPEHEATANFLYMSQIMCRLDHYLHTPYEGVEMFSVTLYEPIMVGPCKPSEHHDIGCWSDASSIIPYIERFNLKIDFDDKDMFELDQYDDRDVVHSNLFNNYTYYPVVTLNSTKSKLHCCFVEQPVHLPVQIPCLDTQTFLLDKVYLARSDPLEVSFRDLSLTRKPSLMLFYCKSKVNKKYEDTVMSDKSASIVKCTFDLDNYNRAFKLDTKAAIDIASIRSYPGYIPPISATGNVLALPFSELPVRKSMTHNKLHGRLTVMQNWYSYGRLPVDIYATFFYHDKFFDVENNYQTVRLDLDVTG